MAMKSEVAQNLLQLVVVFGAFFFHEVDLFFPNISHINKGFIQKRLVLQLLIIFQIRVLSVDNLQFFILRSKNMAEILQLLH
jgi:hypothetical protein